MCVLFSYIYIDIIFSFLSVFYFFFFIFVSLLYFNFSDYQRKQLFYKTFWVYSTVYRGIQYKSFTPAKPTHIVIVIMGRGAEPHEYDKQTVNRMEKCRFSCTPFQPYDVTNGQWDDWDERDGNYFFLIRRFARARSLDNYILIITNMQHSAATGHISLHVTKQTGCNTAVQLPPLLQLLLLLSNNVCHCY